MFCVNCGKKLEDSDRFCTSCGWPVEQEESGAVAETVQPPVEEGNREETSVSETVVQPPAVENTQMTPQGGYYQAPGQAYGTPYNYGGMPQGSAPGMDFGEPVKKKKGWKKALLIGIPVLLLVVLIGGISVLGANFFKRTFSSPEGYFAYVMEKALREDAETAANIYNNLFKERWNITDKSLSGEITVNLGEEGREFLEDMDILDDAGWLEEVTLETNASMKDKIVSANLALKLGKDEVLSGNAVIDANSETAYVQIPSLSDTYIGAEYEEIMGEISYYLDDMDIFEYWDTLYECCPDKKTVEKLLYKYSCLAISCIDDVEKSKDTVEAGDISQKCTALKATINNQTLQNMLETVLKEMREDEELKKILKDLSSVGGMEDLYDDYRDAMDEILDEVDNIDLDEKIILEVYVNGRGELIGFKLKYDETELLCVRPEDGKKFGCEMSFETYGEGFRLEGTGKKSGDKSSGDFELKIDSYYGTQRIGFRLEDVDTKAAKEGNIKGTFILPLKELDGIYGLDSRMLRKYEMVLAMDIGESKQKMELSLMNDQEKVAALLCDFTTGPGKKAGIPSSRDVIMVEDEDDLEDWMDTVDVDRFIDSLEKTKLPSDIVDEIEDVLGWVF